MAKRNKAEKLVARVSEENKHETNYHRMQAICDAVYGKFDDTPPEYMRALEAERKKLMGG